MKALFSIAAIGLAACAHGSAANRGAATVQTVLQPSSTNPLVAFRVLVRVGSSEDPPGKEGLAALTAAMVAEAGTRALTYSEVLDALYPMAGHIQSHVDKDVTVFWGTVHRDNATHYASLLADLIAHPGLREDDFARNRQSARDGIVKGLRGNDDEELGKKALESLMYRDHPYAHPSGGTASGLAAITLADVAAFHGQYYARDRTIVGLGGGFDAALAKTFVNQVNRLPSASPKRPALPPPAGCGAAPLLLVTKDVAGTAISLGHPLPITRTDEAFYPLFVAASYLGEHRTFNGVLMQKMRGERGLNYGDYAYVENFVQDGWSTFPLPNVGRRQQHFEIWIRPVPHRNDLFALRHAIYETNRLLEDGLSEGAFDDTRQFLLSYSRLWTQDASRRLGYAIDAVLYGRDLQEELRARLPSMTREDVHRAVEAYLHPNALCGAVVTPKPQSVLDRIAAGQPTPMTYDTEGTPDEVLAEDLAIQIQPLSTHPEAVHTRPAAQMFE